MHLKKAVFLDYRSVDAGDLSKQSLLEALDDWQWYDETSADRRLERIREACVIVSNKVPIDRELMHQAKNLKLICIAATGTDKIDLAAAKSLGIQVCNVTAYATPAVVQHVFALILALKTNLIQYNADVRSGSWQKASQFCLLEHPISEINGGVLGVLGYGELGKGVARVAEAFGMQVLVAKRSGDDSRPGRYDLTELLAKVDVLSIHLPLNENTRNLIDEAELAMMKSHALIINTARGGIVNESALARALRAGTIGGAGFDVLSVEPPVAGNPLLDNEIPNLIVTPHTAWASRESRQRLLDEIAKNIISFESGSVRNQVA